MSPVAGCARMPAGPSAFEPQTPVAARAGVGRGCQTWGSTAAALIASPVFISPSLSSWEHSGSPRRGGDPDNFLGNLLQHVQAEVPVADQDHVTKQGDPPQVDRRCFVRSSSAGPGPDLTGGRRLRDVDEAQTVGVPRGVPVRLGRRLPGVRRERHHRVRGPRTARLTVRVRPRG